MEKIKTLFFGSGDFAIPIIRELANLEYIDLIGVVTQPDKPFGRKKLMKPTPLGEYVSENKVISEENILKPVKLKLHSNEILDKYRPDLIIVASYGQIIPHEIVHYPKYKALNFHGSLLPKLRGAVPVQISILHDFKQSGVTLQIMEDGMDVGDIIATREYTLKDDETSETLMHTLAELSAEIVKEDLIKWIAGDLKPQKQDESSATYCFKSDISKEKAEIKADTDILLAERMIRSFYPWPVAWIKFKDKTLKIYKALVAEDELFEGKEYKPMEIFRSDKKLFLKISNGYLELIEIQLEGKKRDSAENYLFLGA